MHGSEYKPDIVGNKVIIRACIMDSEMPYFLSFGHYASSAWCIMRYTVCPCVDVHKSIMFIKTTLEISPCFNVLGGL